MSSAVLRSPSGEEALTADLARRMPKVLLHDHLDGGVRPSTVVELAAEYDYTALPTTDVDDLASSFRRGANRRDLGLYLQTFAHTVGVLQHAGALTRVAGECARDLADDGVVYAEVRFAPELHLAAGLSPDEVVEAVLAGFRRGSVGRPITVATLVTAMRTAARSLEIAELAVRHRDEGVVGFDIAGAEKGYPPSRHLDAFHLIAHENFHFTIHAGEAAAAAAVRPIVVRALITAMRTAARSAEIAALALRFRDEGVVGFDIAGAEAGFPPSRHMDAFDLIRLHHFHITIHAGEAFGLPSISEALSYCGAERLGHGVRIVDDITRTTGGGVMLGRLADYVRDRRVPLEMCPTSNVHTGAAVSYDDHPIGLLMDLGFRVTVNTDNRLMSGVSLSDEFLHLADAFGVGLVRSEWLTVNAMKSAFVHFDERLALINDTIKPAYAALRAGRT